MATFDWDEEIDSEAGDRDFVNFDEVKGDITLMFEEDTPRVREDSKYKKPRYTFRVDEDKLFSTMSVRLMAGLKEHRPLKGKTLHITRTGINYETQYDIIEV